jgi:hypothetical protein
MWCLYFLQESQTVANRGWRRPPAPEPAGATALRVYTSEARLRRFEILKGDTFSISLGYPSRYMGDAAEKGPQSEKATPLT